VRHTKIIATLGPGTSDRPSIEALLAAGVDVFRLNFSHGTHAEHAARFHHVRDAAKALGRIVAILQDLGGPKIRTGKLEGGGPVAIEPGQHLVIGIGDFVGGPGRVSTTYAPLARAVAAGDRLLLDDGKLELQVESVTDGEITTRVLVGGPLGEHKGINAPNVPLPAVGITEKDASDLEFGLALGIDLIGLSFVQSAEDMRRARQLTERAGRPDVPLVAKLERPEAIARLDEVLAAADAVMVARGDLGLEVPLERVPRVQKEVLRVARARGVPVIVATQVMESMRSAPRPTRAEVSDAAGAVDGGAAAIMLSGETAVGLYPVRSVQVLDSIIRDAESMPPVWTSASSPQEPTDHVAALCDAAVTLASRGQIDVVVAVTREGRTARLLSARRPSAPIYAATEKVEVARRLALWWGVTPLVVPLEGHVDEVADRIIEHLKSAGFTSQATIAIVNASPNLDRGAANFLRIRRIG
jgi:pyruvate kinase